MPELASDIKINKQTGKVTINGDEFPWYIAEGGVTLDGLGTREAMKVNLSVLTRRVEIVPLKHDEKAREAEVLASIADLDSFLEGGDHA